MKCMKDVFFFLNQNQVFVKAKEGQNQSCK